MYPRPRVRREQPKSRFRFSFGELFAAFVIGVVGAGYGNLCFLLLAKCTCDRYMAPDPDMVVALIQWGLAILGVWILVVTVMVIRYRD